MTENFLRAASESNPAWMISEGTRVTLEDKRLNLSEQQVYDGISAVCAKPHHANKLAIYTHGPRDMDRLRTFYDAALACGRRIVISPRTAYLLAKLIHDEHLDLPDPSRDTSISVYYRRKKSGSYDESDYYKWERSFLDKIVTPTELKRDPGGYMVNIDFSSLTELIDIRPEVGTPFVFSMSEHFAEEDVEGVVLQNWLRHFGMEYVQLHASGHIGMSELAEAVSKVNPGRLFPVHTEHPELFLEMCTNVTQPTKGIQYRL